MRSRPEIARDSFDDADIVVRFFGNVSLHIDGQECRLRVPRRALEVLALLACHHGRRVERNLISQALWPDSPEEEGRANLRRYLHLLSKTLPGADRSPWFLGDKVALWWNAEAPYRVDLFEFQSLYTQGDAKSALAHYGGDLLVGAFSEWIEPYRERFRSMALQLLRQQAGSEDHAEAIAAAERGLSIDPYDEEMVRRLITRRAVAGDRAGAVARYHQFGRRLRDDLGTVPEPETSAIFESILNEAGQRSNRHTTLPRPNTTFHGRDTDVATLLRILDTESLVTLVGPGGIGKTRLAIEAAWRTTDAFPGSVWFVDFGSITLGKDAVEALRRSVGDTSQHADPLEAIRQRCAEQRTLFIFDNCERILVSAARLARDLTAVSGTHIIATSRRALGVPGERQLRVSPLRIPDLRGDAVATIAESPAVRLFVDRASELDASIALTNDNARMIADIVSRLDGLPLAIELAASRARLLSIDDIAERVTGSIDILRPSSAPRIAQRHDTLESTIEWSVALLSPGARSLFAYLSIFPGAFDLIAAEAVCTSDDVGTADVLPLLNELVEGSLLSIEQPKADAVRYRMLETIRRYARTLPGASSPDVCERHAIHFKQRVHNASSARKIRNGLRADHDNFMAALRWYESQADVENIAALTFGLAWYWRRTGHVREGIAVVHYLLDKYLGQAQPRARAELTRSAGILANARGDWSASCDWNGQAAIAFAQCGDRLAAIEARVGVIHARSSSGQPIAKTIAQYEEAHAELCAIGEEVTAAELLANIGISYYLSGDRARARKHLVSAVAICREHGRLDSAAQTLIQLAAIYRVDALHDEALACVSEGLAIARELGDPTAEANALRIFAQVNLDAGRLEEAGSALRTALNDLDFGYETLSSIFTLETVAELFAKQCRWLESARILGLVYHIQQRHGVGYQSVMDKNPELISLLRSHLGERFELAFEFGGTLTLASVERMLGSAS